MLNRSCRCFEKPFKGPDPLCSRSRGREPSAQEALGGVPTRDRSDKGCAVKKVVTPDARRGVVRHLREQWKFSERKACRIARISHSVIRYKKRPDRNVTLRKRLKELAEAYPRLGSPMLYMMLRNEGLKVNHKRVERLYREEKLALRRKRRRKFSVVRAATPKASRPMGCLALDFMSDAVVGGRKLRVLTTVDEFSKLSPVLTVGFSLTGRDVVRTLNKVAVMHGLPERLRMDNGPEFRSRVVIEWALTNGVKLDYIQPGKQTQNAFIESFNARCREECLDQELFLSLDDARAKIEKWRTFYNNFRPHSALGGMPPRRFLAESRQLAMTGTNL